MAKEKFTFEFEMKNTSFTVLWTFISTPSGLSKWFCDDVNVNDKKYTFFWQKNTQTAELLNIRQGVFVRFRWEEDKDTKYYFEIKINSSEMSGELEIAVTDFCEADEVEETKDLWKKQIDLLKHAIGV